MGGGEWEGLGVESGGGWRVGGARGGECVEGRTTRTTSVIQFILCNMTV